jgi:hypothetical protein
MVDGQGRNQLPSNVWLQNNNAWFGQLTKNKCIGLKVFKFYEVSIYTVIFLLCVVSSVTCVKNIMAFISVSFIFIVQCVIREANSKLKCSIVFKNM